jgi:hypothetical protein
MVSSIYEDVYIVPLYDQEPERKFQSCAKASIPPAFSPYIWPLYEPEQKYLFS